MASLLSWLPTLCTEMHRASEAGWKRRVPPTFGARYSRGPPRGPGPNPGEDERRAGSHRRGGRVRGGDERGALQLLVDVQPPRRLVGGQATTAARLCGGEGGTAAQTCVDGGAKKRCLGLCTSPLTANKRAVEKKPSAQIWKSLKQNADILFFS